ncbi:cobyric acid synthase [Lentibacillus cibarius]|uniref:Cobyric acid synthase n=1 Tax=Lentibacillus cibarius TaxID=2583219 RepID=A0A5S3QNM5_9BACI|nr:cobyric acid synthase [Lentibacillus cibarius]TMN23307.1 cobyric acid synthase [Lentibacillus cibarius]
MKGMMIQGTASNVGKSLFTTALCRLFANKGYTVAPFKAQNMSNRTIQTEDGKEMSVAQAQQAKAANYTPSVLMNPIILKPGENHQTKVVFMGETMRTMDGRDYQQTYYHDARQTIQAALSQLDQAVDFTFLEGAGSPVEMNLKDYDLANMAVAEMADVSVILVADIDKGGAFASIVGTLALFTQKERNRVKGLVINKFHGDVSSFASGRQWLEDYTGIPVLGVIPYIDHDLVEEDGMIDVSTLEAHTSDLTDKDATYEKLAGHLEAHIDVEKLLSIMLGEVHVN